MEAPRLQRSEVCGGPGGASPPLYHQKENPLPAARRQRDDDQGGAVTTPGGVSVPSLLPAASSAGRQGPRRPLQAMGTEGFPAQPRPAQDPPGNLGGPWEESPWGSGPFLQISYPAVLAIK